MTTILSLIGREEPLFNEDITNFNADLKKRVNEGTFLVIGGAGSIGQAVVKEIFKRNPQKLHVVDISENNLVELVRDLRSSYGYIDGDFKTFALEIAANGDISVFENPYWNGDVTAKVLQLLKSTNWQVQKTFFDIQGIK